MADTPMVLVPREAVGALLDLIPLHDKFMRAQGGCSGNQEDAYNLVAARWNEWAKARTAAETVALALMAAPSTSSTAEQVGDMWSAARNLFFRHAEAFNKAIRYEEASAIADKAGREIEALYDRPTPATPEGRAAVRQIVAGLVNGFTDFTVAEREAFADRKTDAILAALQPQAQPAAPESEG